MMDLLRPIDGGRKIHEMGQLHGVKAWFDFVVLGRYCENGRYILLSSEYLYQASDCVPGKWYSGAQECCSWSHGHMIDYWILRGSVLSFQCGWLIPARAS